MIYLCSSLAWAHNWLSVILLGVNFGWALDPFGFCGNSWLIMGMWWALFPGDTPKVCTIQNEENALDKNLWPSDKPISWDLHLTSFDLFVDFVDFCSAISISSLQNWSLGNGATCFVPCHPIKTLFLANTTLKFDLQLSWFNFSAFTLAGSSGPRNRVAPTH